MVGAAAYALGPLDGLGDDTAEFLLYTLTPRLVAAMLLLHLSLLRWVGRFPVKVYAGEHPVVRKMVRRCPSFQRDYRPPSWAVGWLPQAVLYVVKSWWNSHIRGFRREPVKLPDGEHVSLFWMAPPAQEQALESLLAKDLTLAEAFPLAIPPSMPVIIICHGVFQTPADLYEFAQFLTRDCGYLACVFNRRGNDLPLSRPRFNTTGDQQDFRFMLDLIRRRLPTNGIYGVGISAGSSLLGRYLGDAGDESLLAGGVLISPGYDMEKSLRYMNPLLDRAITLHAKSFFLSRNQQVLEERCPAGLHKLYRSRSMHEFHQHQHVFDGKGTAEEYFNTHNPVFVLDKIQRPTVYINAYDDPCFPGSFTYQFRDLVRRCDMATVVHLEKGGHATFYENWDARSSRAFQIVKEFVECMQQEGALLTQ